MTVEFHDRGTFGRMRSLLNAGTRCIRLRTLAVGPLNTAGQWQKDGRQSKINFVSARHLS
jgi:hypothetical protein